MRLLGTSTKNRLPQQLHPKVIHLKVIRHLDTMASHPPVIHLKVIHQVVHQVAHMVPHRATIHHRAAHHLATHHQAIHLKVKRRQATRRSHMILMQPRPVEGHPMAGLTTRRRKTIMVVHRAEVHRLLGNQCEHCHHQIIATRPLATTPMPDLMAAMIRTPVDIRLLVPLTDIHRLAAHRIQAALITTETAVMTAGMRGLMVVAITGNRIAMAQHREPIRQARTPTAIPPLHKDIHQVMTATGHMAEVCSC